MPIEKEKNFSIELKKSENVVLILKQVLRVYDDIHTATLQRKNDFKKLN